MRLRKAETKSGQFFYMKFDIITIFPEAFKSYLNTSMLKRARDKKIADVRVHDLRKFAQDKSRLPGNRGSSSSWSGHKKVDDRPYGGGPGMVLKIEPIIKAFESILRNPKSKILPMAKPSRILDKVGTNPKKIQNSKPKIQKNRIKIILFSAAGKQFTQKMAAGFAPKYERIIMIAGHYEGVDERVKRVIRDLGFMIQEVSIGPYVLTGGELPAMVVIDAVSRHLPGFLGKAESLEEKRYGIGVPVYTRPETFEHKGKNYKVPKVLLSGAHKKIAAWRESRARRASP